MKKHVLFGCMLVMAMLLSRLLYTGHGTYLFLIWNMFLAFVPLLLAYIASRFSFRSWKLLLTSVVWLLFFPNAPYLITDLYHLTNLAGAPVWYDALMLFTAAYTCVAMGFVSLKMMEKLWKKHWQARWMTGKWYLPWLPVLLLFVATGFGLYLGRVLRYNSWDVITDTNNLVLDIATRVVRPIRHFQTWGFTFVYAACLFFFYQVWMGNPVTTGDVQRENKSDL